MNESKIKFMREVINLLPMTSKNLTTYSKEMNWNSRRLYDFRRGMFPKEEEYNHFLDFMLDNYRYEMAQIMAVLNVTQEDIYNVEESIERYFEKISS